MKRKILWLILSCLLLAALVLASCAPAAPPAAEKPTTPTTEKPTTPTTEKPAPPEEKEAAPTAEGPTYGGWITYAGVQLLGFDPAMVNPWANYAGNFTNEELLTGDWAKGMGGTNEASWLTDDFFLHLSTGVLAESWEIPDDQTVIFHIRKGVYWHNKPPVNGREMVAEDIVFSINRLFNSPRAYIAGASIPEERPVLTAPDKYTLVAKLWAGAPRARLGEIFRLSDLARIVPPEVIEKYGDMNDWENVCGTGPFILTNFVSMSSCTFERNPAYWRKDPLHPENTLPYVDGVKMLQLPDASTLLAALRTGKIDFQLDVTYEDADALMKSNPEMKYLKHLRIYDWGISMRLDLPELPFNDKRVRQALMMAINYPEIVSQFYRGYAEALAYPLAPVAEYMDAYVSLEELPESVRQLFEYHPDRSKELLAEAGYPNGFKTSIICHSGAVDDLSLIKNYWAEIGVDVELEVKEWGTYSWLGYGQSPEGRANYSPTIYTYRGLNNSTGFLASYKPWNATLTGIDDPRQIKHTETLMLNQMDWPALAKEWRDYAQWSYEEVYSIPFPTPMVWTFWQPWLKGYHGERGVGLHNEYDFPKYLWIDQDLKEEMTGKR